MSGHGEIVSAVWKIEGIGQYIADIDMGRVDATGCAVVNFVTL